MNKDQQSNKIISSEKSNVNKTNPEKVKQEIRKDVSAGIGSMTAREAGHMRD